MKLDHSNYPRQRPLDTLRTESQEIARNGLHLLGCILIVLISAFAVYESFVAFCR